MFRLFYALHALLSIHRTVPMIQVYASRPGALQSPRIEVPVRRYDAMESGRWDTNEIRAVIFDGVGVCW